MSLAAAMTLDYVPGIFFRGAKLYCINLLLTYPEGCLAKCAYCGLSSARPGMENTKSFIRVQWPIHGLDDIIRRIELKTDRIKRICISMITRKRAVSDTVHICKKLRGSFDIPVSILTAPTILTHQHLIDFKEAGADKIGVAIDLATAELFDRYRGKYVNGPHQWETYWHCLNDAVQVFGLGNAGAHFIVGMGETEKEMCQSIQAVRDMGGFTHLFSFFPEALSALADKKRPTISQYRRIQLARFLIDHKVSCENQFEYDHEGKIACFGVNQQALESTINSGEPFRTSGCTGYDGQVACNRPYGNSRPGPHIRNYPFPLKTDDIERIRIQLRI
jgi:biotin synthase